MTVQPLPDQLLARVRVRALDPDTRTDASGASRRAIAAMGEQIRSVSADLGALLGLGDTADPGFAFGDDDALPDPADEEVLASAEAALGTPLPPPLLQLYAIANGGFGPGEGLFPMEKAVEEYRELASDPPGPPGGKWPASLLPIAERDSGYFCFDCRGGAVVGWDPETLVAGESAEHWQQSFVEVAPGLAEWLESWLARPSSADLVEDALLEEKVALVREGLALCREMSAEERAEMGLPGDDWERDYCRRHNLDPDLVLGN